MGAPEPDRFDVHREGNRHIAFGFGPHFCVGAPLARIEATVAISKLLALRGPLSLAGRPVWGDSFVVRSLARLPLALSPIA